MFKKSIRVEHNPLYFVVVVVFCWVFTKITEEFTKKVIESVIHNKFTMLLFLLSSAFAHTLQGNSNGEREREAASTEFKHWRKHSGDQPLQQPTEFSANRGQILDKRAKDQPLEQPTYLSDNRSKHFLEKIVLTQRFAFISCSRIKTIE